MPVGAWIALSPLLLGGGLVDIANNVLVGLAVPALSLPRGPISERFGARGGARRDPNHHATTYYDADSDFALL